MRCYDSQWATSTHWEGEERGEGAIVTLSYEATADRVGITNGRNDKC